MDNGGIIVYNVAVFVSALFLLEFGADKFVEHTAVLGRRTGIPDTVIALLTAGAEWEELAVVISALVQGRPSLAVGNVVGSAISNILGAFSLGLLFRAEGQLVHFDRSSRIYSLLLLLVTSFAAPVVYLPYGMTQLICGAIMISIFAAYIVSIGWAVSKGSLVAPVASDDDDRDDTNGIASARTSIGQGGAESQETDALLHQGGGSVPASLSERSDNHTRRSLGYHIFYLLLGLLAICLSGYILSHAATNVTGAIGISDVLFGVVILAIATTLPEKFIAVMSGHRGHTGILVANTVGSNIFLLSLCMGIVMVDTSGKFNGGKVNSAELAVLWGSSLALTLTVWVGKRLDRWIGGAMLAGYVAFILLEFTVIHSVGST